MDVLANNALAGALHRGFTKGNNLARVFFVDPAAREFYADWDRVAPGAVAALRASAGTDLDDPRLTELIGELSLKSEPFRRLWARHDVRDETSGAKRFNHPLVGELTLNYNSFAVSGAAGQLLTVYHAERARQPHTRSRFCQASPPTIRARPRTPRPTLSPPLPHGPATAPL